MDSHRQIGYINFIVGFTSNKWTQVLLDTKVTSILSHGTSPIYDLGLRMQAIVESTQQNSTLQVKSHNQSQTVLLIGGVTIVDIAPE